MCAFISWSVTQQHPAVGYSPLVQLCKALSVNIVGSVTYQFVPDQGVHADQGQRVSPVEKASES